MGALPHTSHQVDTINSLMRNLGVELCVAREPGGRMVLRQTQQASSGSVIKRQQRVVKRDGWMDGVIYRPCLVRIVK